jgi:hypothetical protein
MQSGGRYQPGSELPGTREAVPLGDQLPQSADTEGASAPRAARRWWAAAAWAAAGLALYAFFVRISFSGRIDSDGANSALQAWDLIHGHLVMHGWLIGDATFYAFELPINGVMQLIFGLGSLATHLASALTFLIVAGCAVALAVADSRGPARAVRGAVALTVLAVPLLTMLTVWLLVEEPDHTGTSVFILISCLLIDRAPSRKFTAPLLCLILCAGQLSDLTVRYVAVPAIIVVCGYRVLATRKLRSGDAALVLAAAVSVPLESLLYSLMAHLGGFLMIPPKAQLAPPSLWRHHLPVVWLDIRELFGAVLRPDTKLGGLGAALGLICLIAAILGLGRVAWTWRRASRAEQLLAAAIVCNVGVYALSVMPLPSGYREIVALLPCGAALAARALVPARITGELRAFAAVTATALVALLPLSVAATRPAIGPAMGPAPGNGATAQTAPLTAWLEAHGLSYGVGGYWDASVISLQSGDKVRIRAIDLDRTTSAAEWKVNEPYWETNALWYDPSQYDASFAVADTRGIFSRTALEGFFGKPSATYRVENWYVLVYRTNLLRKILPPLKAQ